MTKDSTPDVAIDFIDEEERRLLIVDIVSSTDGDQVKDSNSNIKVSKEEKEATEQNPVQSQIPIAATPRWEIDFVQVDTESDN